MDIVLNDTETRVLGSLMEKALSTPDYYPLSLHALINACNQKSSREPVVSFDEETVRKAADDLIKKDLVNQSNVSRVTKYEECFSRQRNLVPREISALCVLLLRGPQTAGEIRNRTSRMCNFESLDGVLETINNLEAWGFAQRLDRLPGHKESRYAHLFCGEPNMEKPEMAASPGEAVPGALERIEKLELTMESLKNELEELKKAFQAFKGQFE